MVQVALRKESVDRNFSPFGVFFYCMKSLSVRRAWIEIPIVPAELVTLVKSLSVRRAWIEILYEGGVPMSVTGRSP